VCSCLSYIYTDSCSIEKRKVAEDWWARRILAILYIIHLYPQTPSFTSSGCKCACFIDCARSAYEGGERSAHTRFTHKHEHAHILHNVFRRTHTITGYRKEPGEMGGTNSITALGPYLNGLWLAVVSRCSIGWLLQMSNSDFFLLLLESSPSFSASIYFLLLFLISSLLSHTFFLFSFVSYIMLSSSLFLVYFSCASIPCWLVFLFPERFSLFL
jgi:hypothetical protein